jgi:hypothetical protein
MMNIIITDLISGSSCRVYGKNPTLNNRKVSFFCTFSGFFVASSTYTEIRNTVAVYLQKYYMCPRKGRFQKRGAKCQVLVADSLVGVAAGGSCIVDDAVRCMHDRRCQEGGTGGRCWEGGA